MVTAVTVTVLKSFSGIVDIFLKNYILQIQIQMIQMVFKNLFRVTV